MADHRHEAPGENGTPVPRDMPDQQAGADEDRWEVAPDREGGDERQEGREAEPATDVPDTDVAGTGRRGDTRADTAHTDHPTPDEPSD
ncbi:hypothetical protein ABZ920_03125 [Streptomyces sp. NPDC046831]|uniref:hypothetical protein n=1 Tax=Streptomyces sp. NPDC046831 TaxID=3154805 RepID=UPI00340903C6